MSTRKCHASCCYGETELDSNLYGTCHDMQMILDREEFGFASGYFGERHEPVLKAMARAYADGWETAAEMARRANQDARANGGRG